VVLAPTDRPRQRRIFIHLPVAPKSKMSKLTLTRHPIRSNPLSSSLRLEYGMPHEPLEPADPGVPAEWRAAPEDVRSLLPGVQFIPVVGRSDGTIALVCRPDIDGRYETEIPVAERRAARLAASYAAMAQIPLSLCDPGFISAIMDIVLQTARAGDLNARQQIATLIANGDGDFEADIQSALFLSGRSLESLLPHLADQRITLVCLKRRAFRKADVVLRAEIIAILFDTWPGIAVAAVPAPSPAPRLSPTTPVRSPTTRSSVPVPQPSRRMVAQPGSTSSQAQARL
jgi:hypothetical protein